MRTSRPKTSKSKPVSGLLLKMFQKYSNKIPYELKRGMIRYQREKNRQ